MGATFLDKIVTEDEELRQVQDNVAAAFDPIARNPLVDGLILKDIALVSGSVNVVSHKLDRTLQGWIPIRVRAQATLWDSQASNLIPDKTLKLNTSANVTVDLYVF